jgi:hypothetical protein
MFTADRRHRNEFPLDQFDTIVICQDACLAHPVVLIDRQQTAPCRRITGEQAQVALIHGLAILSPSHNQQG